MTKKHVPSIQNLVFWQREQRGPPRRALDRDLHADVAVIGGGMAGLTCARRLAAAGRSVVLLEREICGGGASGRSSGFITPDSELELSELLKRHGEDEARRLWELVGDGVLAIRDAAERLEIDCDLQQQDSLFIANSRSAFREVQEEHASRLRLNLESRLYERGALKSIVGTDGYWGGVRYAGTFAMNPFQFCRGLASVLETKGVRIFEQTAVKGVDRDGAHTERHRVEADHIAVCTDCCLPNGLEELTDKVHHVQTFLAVTRPLSGAECDRLFPDGRLMVWDTDLIYQYFRLTADNRLLVGAGSLLHTYGPHRDSTPTDVIGKLRNYLQRKFPWLSTDFEYTWPGMIGVSRDFLGISDSGNPSRRVGTVLAATGLPWAAALGIRLAEQILGTRGGSDSALTASRDFPLPDSLRYVVGKRAVFALSHLWVKEVQR